MRVIQNHRPIFLHRRSLYGCLTLSDVALSNVELIGLAFLLLRAREESSPQVGWKWLGVRGFDDGGQGCLKLFRVAYGLGVRTRQSQV